MATIVPTITTQGYQAAANNTPNRDGFRIELKFADIYVRGTKKGRFPVTGVRVGGNQVRVRCTVTSEREEYSYDEVRLIDGISNVEFAVLKRSDNSVIDFVAPHKKSTFSYNITFASVADNRITIIADNGNAAALAELDTHKTDTNAHKALFDKKADKTALDALANRRATTTQTGLVQLDDSLTQSTNKAITPAAVKAALGTLDTDLSQKINTLNSKAVTIDGTQTVSGEKTFTAVQRFKNNIQIASSSSDYTVNQYLEIGSNNTNAWFLNKKSGKYFSMRNDGELRYDGYRVLDARDAIPSGAVMHFARNTPPSGWLKADGSAVSRSTYAALFAAIGTTFGAGDGRTTFNLPDLRGEFVRGWDNGRGADSGRAFGSAQTAAMAEHFHGFGIMTSTDDMLMPYRTWNDTEMMDGVVICGEGNAIVKRKFSSEKAELVYPLSSGKWGITNGTYNTTAGDWTDVGTNIFHIATRNAQLTGKGETRPRNIALLACIKI